jgi:hypothetical protein
MYTVHVTTLQFMPIDAKTYETEQEHRHTPSRLKNDQSDWRLVNFTIQVGYETVFRQMQRITGTGKLMLICMVQERSSSCQQLRTQEQHGKITHGVDNW